MKKLAILAFFGGLPLAASAQIHVFGTVSPSSTEAVSVSPIGTGFTGNYVLRFDAWQNFQGSFPGGGNGTTQALIGGVGAVDETRQWVADKIDGAAFAATGDGGSGNDYRAYTNFGSIVAENSGAYAAGSVTGVTNNSNAYYSGFKGAVPAAQTAIAAGYSPSFSQTGQTSTGALGMAWHQWEIVRFKDTITWKVDGLRIATVTKSTLGGDNIFLGYFDTNGNPSTDAVSNQLLFGLVDNVSVQAVPEPGTMVALGLGAAAMLRRRKKAQ
ncbi:PEP-CTERM sorting domain-containing protein [bacterium]|nr:MAG: PEP-CTERM sorting domain-containing protein [bacterium]